jgi:uncharacterized RDD family membrane protein YckC
MTLSSNSEIDFDNPDAQVPNLIGHYAGFTSRAVAFTIDTLIMSSILIAIPWLLQLLIDTISLNLFLRELPINQVIFFFTTIVFRVIFIYAYYAFFWFFTGQTPGKSLMGVRVIRKDGRRLGPLMSLFRMFGYVISALLLGAGYLWVLVDDRRQGFHDKIAGTFVVYAWEARPDEGFVSPDHVSRYSQKFRDYLKLPSKN